MNDPGLTDLYEAAARAAINERCAPAFLHDVRGSMQALFSALELLGRSARSGGGDREKVERVYDLAKRAITHHEKATMDALQLLTLQRTVSGEFDLGELLREVAHFLRTEAASRDIALQVDAAEGIKIRAERTKLQTLLVGLVTAALDAMPSGGELLLSLTRQEHDAIIAIGSDAGYDAAVNDRGPSFSLNGTTRAKELTLLFAQRFTAASGGRLVIDPEPKPRGTMRLSHPISGSTI